ncbi:hypothetical protein [Arenibacter troitsensis]|uniref:CHRD domain-containing protein n=1 Tax=Arenibacter troitsensis TaxID=188872 RepID=A0A1X7HZN3_9FLAO|nr:hypothetical protein [Arenibacter troitsensis]SMG07160.1 hypothetical protein SAMN03080602_00219 [Arenibacter troitsensis]
MKKYFYLFLISISLLISGCNNDDSSSDSSSTSVKVFTLSPVTNSKITGKVTFKKNEDGSTTVLLEINGSSTDVHPAFIYFNNVATGGEIAITLEPIDCDCESSSTIITTLDDGTPITYEQLLKFDGHIKIHQNEEHLEIIITQGNIGANAN